MGRRGYGEELWDITDGVGAHGDVEGDRKHLNATAGVEAREVVLVHSGVTRSYHVQSVGLAIRPSGCYILSPP